MTRTTVVGLALISWASLPLPAMAQSGNSAASPLAPSPAGMEPTSASPATGVAPQEPTAPQPPPAYASRPSDNADPSRGASTRDPNSASASDASYRAGNDPGYDSTRAYEEPPLPPEQPKSKSKIPDFSVRVDPLNWILEGRLGTEIEVALLDSLTIETVPVFVTSEQPPLLNLQGVADTLYQKSGGLGPMSGATIGLGYWLDGKAFRGYVLRAIFTNYSYKYEAREAGAIVDSVKHTERRLGGMIGSHSRWGAFTLASGLGLGVEMNRHRRCEDAAGNMVTEGCQEDQLAIRLNANNDKLDLFGPLHPAYFFFRISLGLVF
jgi:hypothetical protein